MIASGHRHIKSGKEFNCLFPIPEGDSISIKKRAVLADTIGLMKKVIKTTLSDTSEIAKHLKAGSIRKTCHQIWSWCYHHFQYKKDEDGTEQVRRPSRSWQDRKKGIDCDCFSVLIGSILTNLNIPFVLRMTKYEAQEYEHIYPVALMGNQELIMDCVVNHFNYQVPYTQKKDITMELQYLNGVDNRHLFTPSNAVNNYITDDILDEVENESPLTIIYNNDLPMDAEVLMEQELEGLEGRAERLARRDARQSRRDNVPLRDRIKEGLKKGIHSINKVNPATALLRAGILASMKLNIFQVASKLRFAYWSDQKAREQQMDLNKFNELKRILEKTEKIFFTAGGKAENLKKAILTGKGNQNKMVSLNGLGAIVTYPSDYDNLSTILGHDLYQEVTLDNGLNGLGEVTTAAAVTAASGVMATIAGMIKKLGELFKKGSKASQLLQLQNNTEQTEEKTRRFSVKNIVSRVGDLIQKRKESQAALPESSSLRPLPDNPETTFIPDQSPMKAKSSEMESSDTSGTNNQNWFQKNKALVLGLGGVLAVGGIALAISKSKKSKSLNGPPKKATTSKRKKPTRKKRKTVSRKPKKKTTPSIVKVELT